MTRHSLVVAAFALAALVTVASCGDDHSSGHGADATAAAGSTVGGEFSEAELTFAREMIAHHVQAIEMADLALDSAMGASADVVDLATRIAAAQGPEVDVMNGWLTDAGQAPVDAGMDMEMSDGHDMSTADGMMTAEQMDELAGQTGTEFDRMWLEMMIAHHEGAVSQATAISTEGSNPAVLDLAGEIIAAQNAEITEMQGLLDA